MAAWRTSAIGRAAFGSDTNSPRRSGVAGLGVVAAIRGPDPGRGGADLSANRHPHRDAGYSGLKIPENHGSLMHRTYAPKNPNLISDLILSSCDRETRRFGSARFHRRQT